MLYIVLGMHKSGTTLVSEILHKAGINMVEVYDETKDYYHGNKMERQGTREINHQLLGSAKLSSLDIPLNSLIHNDQHLAQMRKTISEAESNHDEWGFKDPRTCLTYQIWNKVLPPHKLIIVYRHPFYVAKHYIRNYKEYQMKAKGIRGYKALKIWKGYNKILLDLIKSTNRPTIVLNFDDMLRDIDSMKPLFNFIGRESHDYRFLKKNPGNINLFKLRIFDKLSSDKALDIYEELEKLKP